jgi:hypothetical protein
MLFELLKLYGGKECLRRGFMAKTPGKKVEVDESLAFEMIELACAELDTLARAFQIVSEACEPEQEENFPDETGGDDSAVRIH